MDSLKIITYNIHKGFNTAGGALVLEAMRSLIQSTDADIAFTQEVQGEHQLKSRKIKEWPTESQFEFLADKLWPHYAYGKNAVYRHGHHGNAILSKYPFLEWENINVSFLPRASRSILHASLIIPDTNKKLHLLCIHFGLFAAERRQQIHKLCDRINDRIPANEPLLIAGDFNDWRSKLDAQLRADLGLNEAHHSLHHSYAKSFPAFFPLFPLDRIYFRGMEPKVCHTIATDLGLSDHLPLFAEFSL